MKISELLEGTMDDLGLKGHGAELDSDDDGADAFDVKGERMAVQLMKVADSQKGEGKVKTDDGDVMTVSSRTAQSILDMERSPNLKPAQKEQIAKMVQTTAGLQKLIDYVEKK